jgi:anti-sigma factor RsiW
MPRSLTCRELIEFLSAYLENEQPPGERAVFESHLAICPDCVSYVESYRLTIELGRQACDPEAELPEDVPSELVDAILASRAKL